MANLALAFDILARDRGASRIFDKVATSADRAGKSGSSFGVRMRAGLSGLVKVGALAGGAAVAIGGVAIAAGSMGLKTAAANEQAKISFTTMLGSAQKAGSFLRDLQKFAAATPFEFPELQTAASSLISAGVNANKVIPIMRTLGDVTSGMGTGSEGVQRATIALQQMNAAGKITGEDLNQLRDAGIPVYDLLAKAIGKPKAEVVALAQKGKLGKDALDKMMRALETGKGLERFSGLMDKQSKSLSGLWSTFKDTLNMGLAKAIEPLIPLLKDGLGKASEFLAAALPRVAAALQWVVKTAVRLFGVLRDRGVLDRLRDGFAAIGGFVTTKVVPAIQSLWGWIANDLWPAIQKGYQTIMPALQQALAIVKSALGDTGKGGDNFSKTIKAIGHFIVDYLVPILATLISKWLPIVAHQWQVVITAVRLLFGALQKLSSIVASVISFVLKRFADLATMASKVFDALSHVPGFGWAKDAAKKMAAAAGKANDLARAIDNIKRNVTIGVQFRATAGRIKVGDQYVNVGQRKSGGPVSPHGIYSVGENPDGSWNSTTELFVPKSAGTIYNQKQLAGMGARAAGGSQVRLHPHDIAAIVDGLASRPNVISAGSVDRAMGRGLR